MDREEVRLVVAYKINDLSLFEAVAKACSDYVAANEPGALRYEWYVDEDSFSGRLFEVYRDKAALKAHLSGPVFTEIGPKFKNAIQWHLNRILWSTSNGVS